MIRRFFSTKKFHSPDHLSPEVYFRKKKDFKHRSAVNPKLLPFVKKKYGNLVLKVGFTFFLCVHNIVSKKESSLFQKKQNTDFQLVVEVFFSQDSQFWSFASVFFFFLKLSFKKKHFKLVFKENTAILEVFFYRK